MEVTWIRAGRFRDLTGTAPGKPLGDAVFYLDRIAHRGVIGSMQGHWRINSGHALHKTGRRIDKTFLKRHDSQVAESAKQLARL